MSLGVRVIAHATLVGRVRTAGAVRIAARRPSPPLQFATASFGARRNFARRVPGGDAPPPAVEDLWKEVKDDKSGQSYWWNKETNETTALGAPKPGRRDPWEAVTDPSTGQIYWWNKETNQTTALGAPKPSALAPAAGGAPPAEPQQSGGMLRGMAGAIADGMAWGAGMSMAGRLVDGIMGPRQTEVIHRDENAPPGGGGEAAPPPPGSAGADAGTGDQGWGWGGDDANQGDAGGDGGDGGWFGGGDGGGDWDF
eukprot:NODE_17667_length_932_cov_2.366460.p1 GENE.NODE_17667_length_932_cov_2.366460~~NODE_17667_length_932_cov_2.366460.p1  ORF type:complete len:254 (+),score=77.63 NODE_17667_length_932_cov_2.366460:84-845(+)